MKSSAFGVLAAAGLLLAMPAAGEAAVTFTCTATQNRPNADEVFTIPSGQFNVSVPFKATFTFTISGAQANQSFNVSAEQLILWGPRGSEPQAIAARWTNPLGGQIVTCDGNGEYDSGDVTLEGSVPHVQGLYCTRASFEAHDINNPSTEDDVATPIRNYSVTF
jgi:hypothetical protein